MLIEGRLLTSNPHRYRLQGRRRVQSHAVMYLVNFGSGKKKKFFRIREILTYLRHIFYILETLSSSLDVPPMSPFPTHGCVKCDKLHACRQSFDT